jgi:hypothetical protein
VEDPCLLEAAHTPCLRARPACKHALPASTPCLRARLACERAYAGSPRCHSGARAQGP